MQIENTRPLLLSSTIKYENELLIVDLTNPTIYKGRVNIPGDTLHIFRSKFLWDGACHERLRVANFGLDSVVFTLTIRLDADFADIFEVRGTKRASRGKRLPSKIDQDSISFIYEGLDKKVRSTTVKLVPIPERIEDSIIIYKLSLKPKASELIYMTTICDPDFDSSKNKYYKLMNYDKAWEKSKSELESFASFNCELFTSNEQFNNWLNRSFADLHIMLTETKNGIYPYAGVPWFSTIFGRDGIVTALQTLWVNPDIAKGVLANLAAEQAKEEIPEKEAQPGKIIHEKRNGEMAELGEVPFKEYYGSIDATPLFIILAGAYLEHTGNKQFIKSIWPNIEMALQWIDNYGDIDKDGFVEYSTSTTRGLRNQGWKDSKDSIFHSDGKLAEGPIALCEVQGYVYDAKIKASNIARCLGYLEKAEMLQEEAQELKSIFNKVFWLDDLSFYALALDGQKRPCRVLTSNTGHSLYSGIADYEKAQKLVNVLMGENIFTQWGIRTLASAEVQYNPMSYHNGSIWPHDNSLIASGLARYGFNKTVMKILTALFDASIFMELHRLPELYCGFVKREGSGPTLYPVACSPQAWAVGSVFLLLKSCLGLSINGIENQICFNKPMLPSFLEQIEIKNLRVGNNKVSLEIRRYANDVGINILKKVKPVSVIIQK